MQRVLCHRIPCNFTFPYIRKKLITNSFGNINDNRKSKFYSFPFSSAYFNNDKKICKNHGITLSPYPTELKLIHTNILYQVALKTDALDFKKASIAFYKIDMVDLKQVPLPAFWIGMAGLVPFWFPFASSFIIGYSHSLASLQFYYGAALLSCLGGIKWGSIIENKEAGTWENYGLSIVPTIVSVVALCLPRLLGVFLIMVGFLATFIIDLTTSNYSKWFIALRGVLTNISVFFLFIAFLQAAIH